MRRGQSFKQFNKVNKEKEVSRCRLVTQNVITVASIETSPVAASTVAATSRATGLRATAAVMARRSRELLRALLLRLRRERSFGENSILIRLSDTDFDVPDEHDIRGRTVIDQNGNEIGKIDDLLMDPQSRRVRFLQVTSGGFLGIGGKMLLYPCGGNRPV